MVQLICLNKYDNVPVTQASKDKAKIYTENWSHYIEPNEPNKAVDISSKQYQKYKNQPVEKESFRRGEMVVDEYRKALNIDK